MKPLTIKRRNGLIPGGNSLIESQSGISPMIVGCVEEIDARQDCFLGMLSYDREPNHCDPVSNLPRFMPKVTFLRDGLIAGFMRASEDGSISVEAFEFHDQS
jgi:hypothetical protein